MTLKSTCKLCTYFGMKLKKQPFWDLTLCPWVSSSDIPMYRIAFIFIIRLCNNIFIDCSNLKVKALWSLEILEATHLTTPYHIPEDTKLLQHNSENQKSCKGQHCFDKCWNLKGTKTSQDLSLWQWYCGGSKSFIWCRVVYVATKCHISEDSNPQLKQSFVTQMLHIPPFI